MRIFQKKIIRQHHQICCEGRDQASTILKKNPRYDVAFYFKCNLNITSYRRWKDLKKFNKKISLKEVKKSLRTRNEHDIKRRFSALKRVKDSVLIRTDILSKSAMVAKMSEEIEKKMLLKLQDQGEKKFESYLMDEKTWRAPKDVIEDPVFTSNLQKISPGRTGDIIEYEFMNIALKCGWEAFKNISQNGPIDCILINPISAKAYYVDCKSVKTHNEAISQLIALRQKRGMYNIYIGYIFNGKAAIQYGENLSDKIILDPIKEVLSYHEHLKTGGLQEDYN